MAGQSPVPLLDQNRGRWNRLYISRGRAALARAEKLGQARGPYRLQAAIAACHAEAATADATNWARIAALYAALVTVDPSPIVELNRAVAVTYALGPTAGLSIVDAIADEPGLKGYYLLPAVRADILARLGRGAEARTEFERAAAMTKNEREQALLLGRAAEVDPVTA